jgi:hypothetical protein
MRRAEINNELRDFSLAVMITSQAGAQNRTRDQSYLFSLLLVTSFTASKNDLEPGVR